MHNRKNVVLMFLIVMLSFAMVTEVSAVQMDEDAEPGESCLNANGNPEICQDVIFFERFTDI